MKFQHRTLIFISGLLWLVIGIGLLSLGVHFFSQTLKDPLLTLQPGKFSITNFFGRFVPGKSECSYLCLASALLIGFIKGKTAFAKAVKRQITRIEKLPSPAPLKYLYGKGYYLLVACMVLLGISMRFLPITLDTRGFIDIAIGFALMKGAALYFRMALNTAYSKNGISK